MAAQVMRQVKTRTVSPAPALVACRFNRVAGVSGCKMLGLAPSEKRSPPVGIGAASERFAHVRLLPRSLPIIDHLAPSPVSMNRRPPPCYRAAFFFGAAGGRYFRAVSHCFRMRSTIADTDRSSSAAARSNATFTAGSTRTPRGFVRTMTTPRLQFLTDCPDCRHSAGVSQ